MKRTFLKGPQFGRTHRTYGIHSIRKINNHSTITVVEIEIIDILNEIKL